MSVRVLNVITGLGQGGAETVLARLAARVDRQRFELSIVALGGEGVLADPIRAAGISLQCLDMRGGADIPRAVSALRARIVGERPDVVQSWLYHADLIATIASWGTSSRLAWNLRCSEMESRHCSVSTRLVRRSCQLLSSRPSVIIANSQRGLEAHLNRRYRPRRAVVIPNGVDTSLFRPNEDSRRNLRRAWMGPEHRTVIGMVARLHPQKDHVTFLRAAAKLAEQRNDVVFVLVGDGLEPEAERIREMISKFGGAASFRLLGRRSDIPDVMSAFDIGTLSSAFGEGMPNAIAECMACGIPCVVTNVGDSAELVGETGRCVPVGNPEALAAAWISLLDDPDRATLGVAARIRIQNAYAMSAMVERYQSVWLELSRDLSSG